MIIIKEFLEAYLLEIILCAGCLLAGSLARLIAGYEEHAHERDKIRASRFIQLIFIIIFGGLLILSLMIFDH